MNMKMNKDMDMDMDMDKDTDTNTDTEMDMDIQRLGYRISESVKNLIRYAPSPMKISLSCLDLLTLSYIW